MPLLSKNKVKYLTSLKLKKFRDANSQLVAEGNKLVTDLLQKPGQDVILIAATAEWLESNKHLHGKIDEVYECTPTDLEKISSFDTPPSAIAVVPYRNYEPVYPQVQTSLSLALDTVQDPGNLGTIIRTADWFGVESIFCNEGCADRYNPKVIQSSMGSVFNVKIHYVDFMELFQKISTYSNFPVIGTYMNGEQVSELKGLSKGMLVFGNESRGISLSYSGFINRKVTIPPYHSDRFHVESLNVASSVAVTLGIIRSS